MKTGQVLWFSERDGNGIIIDADGNEYYSDISATPNQQPLKRKQLVEFEVNPRIKDCLCAIVTKIQN